MSGGLIATIASLVLLLATYLFGKNKGKEETTTKISGEVTIQRQKAVQAETEADLLSEVAPVAVKAADGMAKAETEYEDAMSRIDEAVRVNDMDALKDISRMLALKAREMGASDKGGPK